MLDLQYIYDACAENGVEIVCDKRGAASKMGYFRYMNSYSGREQAACSKYGKWVLLHNIPDNKVETSLLHELGHLFDPLGWISSGEDLTEELGANRWAIDNYQGVNLEENILLHREAVITYLDNGHTTSSHRSELEPTAITLGIADAITWRD